MPTFRMMHEGARDGSGGNRLVARKHMFLTEFEQPEKTKEKRGPATCQFQERSVADSASKAQGRCKASFFFFFFFFFFMPPAARIHGNLLRRWMAIRYDPVDGPPPWNVCPTNARNREELGAQDRK